MNRAVILQRLEALEVAVSPTPAQRLAFVDVTKLPDADRERYRRGERSVFDRHANPGVRSIVVSLHPAVRASWEATRDMTEEQRGAHDMEQDRREAAEQAASLRPKVVPGESEPRPRAVWGYGRNGEVIYDDDLRLRGQPLERRGMKPPGYVRRMVVSFR